MALQCKFQHCVKVLIPLNIFQVRPTVGQNTPFRLKPHALPMQFTNFTHAIESFCIVYVGLVTKFYFTVNLMINLQCNSPKPIGVSLDFKLCQVLTKKQCCSFLAPRLNAEAVTISLPRFFTHCRSYAVNNCISILFSSI